MKRSLSADVRMDNSILGAANCPLYVEILGDTRWNPRSSEVSPAHKLSQLVINNIYSPLSLILIPLNSQIWHVANGIG